MDWLPRKPQNAPTPFPPKRRWDSASELLHYLLKRLDGLFLLNEGQINIYANIEHSFAPFPLCVFALNPDRLRRHGHVAQNLLDDVVGGDALGFGFEVGDEAVAQRG